MKKWILSILMFMLLTICSGTVFAADGTDENIKASGTCGSKAIWTLDEEGVLTVSGSGSMTTYTTTNKAPWRKYINDIQRIVIEEGITSVGQLAFDCCYWAESVELPETVTALGGAAFSECTSLTKVELPDSIISMAHNVFDECSKLSYVKLPVGLSSIGTGCFSGCEQLETIIFPENLTSIGNGAFWGCIKLGSLAFPDTLKRIGSNAFKSCDSLISVRIPDSVTIIDSEAFAYCDNLKEIILPGNLTEICASCFAKCISLENVVLPETVTGLGAKCFLGCSSLKSLTCGENLKTVGTEAFAGCTELTLYLYQNSMAELHALMYGIPCEYIGVASENKINDAELEYTLQEDGTYYVSGIANRETVNRMIIPSEYKGKVVIGIADNAFSECSELVYVEFPESLEYIGSQAFFQCPRLSRLSIPESVAFIGKRAFWKNRQLYDVQFKEAKYNDICTYAQDFPVSALIGTKYLYAQFKMPGYNLADRWILRDRPESDSIILTKYIDEIIAENQWTELDTYKKIREVYDWMCKNVHYIFDTTIPYASSVGAFLNGVACCSGYAEAYKLIMDRLGVECQFIEGQCTGIYGTVPHIWNLVYNGGWYHVDATDTKYGDYSTFYLTDERLRRVGHTWNAEKYPHVYEATVVKPTCKRQGYTQYQCKTCVDKYTADYTDMIDHIMEAIAAVEPTCTKSGKTEGSRCTMCKEVFVKQETIPATGHTWDNGTVTREPECTKSGVRTFQCLSCEQTKTEKIAAAGHSYALAEFIWTEDYKRASAKFICAGCADIKTVKAAVTSTEGEDSIVYKATAELNGQTYQDSREAVIEKPMDISGLSVGHISDQIYTGNAIEPPVTVMDGTYTLKKGTDYTVLYADNTDAGQATVIVSGTGNYMGEIKEIFTIAPKPIEESWVSQPRDAVYNGIAVEQEMFVKDGEKILMEEKDFTVEFRDNRDVGTATVTIMGCGNYTGIVSKNFNIYASSQDKEPEKDQEQKPEQNPGQDQETAQRPNAGSGEEKETTNLQVQVGTVYTVGGINYKITDTKTNGNGTVTVIGPKDRKAVLVSIGKTIRIKGIVFKVTGISNDAFQGCRKLRTVNINADVTKIGKGAFSGCVRLSKVSISSKVLQTISSKAFYNCKKLSSVQMKTHSLKSVGKSAVKGIAKNAVIRVPSNRRKEYKKLFTRKTGFKKTMKISK